MKLKSLTICETVHSIKSLINKTEYFIILVLHTDIILIAICFLMSTVCFFLNMRANLYSLYIYFKRDST